MPAAGTSAWMAATWEPPGMVAERMELLLPAGPGRGLEPVYALCRRQGMENSLLGRDQVQQFVRHVDRFPRRRVSQVPAHALVGQRRGLRRLAARAAREVER